MGPMLAETNIAGIALLVLGGLLLLVSIVVLTLRNRARGRNHWHSHRPGDVPLSFSTVSPPGCGALHSVSPTGR